MKEKGRVFFLSLTLLIVGEAKAQYSNFALDKQKQTSSVLVKKQPWRAGVEVALTNIGVWSFDRFVLQEDFAKITMHSVRNNFKHAFVWDNDQFSTNLFAHPYHGGLYFNAARSNGLSFWESFPYALGGSLMWEMFAERDPPSINDLMATSMGGMAIGEITNRLSLLVLDDSKGGFSRVGREFLSFLISPMRGLNRLISGKMWKRRYHSSIYHDKVHLPVKFSLGVGSRYLADENHLFLGEHSPFVQLNLDYGNLFSDANEPYDYFTFNGVFNMIGNQPIIGEINILAKLWGVKIDTKDDAEVLFGLFQHFNYLDAEPVVNGRDNVPYKISEAASFGPGFVYRIPLAESSASLEQRVMASAILLGGGLTDYYNIIDRNYNLGSGFGLKSLTHFDLKNYGELSLKMQYYKLFTWKGYHDVDLSTVDPLYLDAQGDKGNAELIVLNPEIRIGLSQKLYLNLGARYYIRRTQYTYHEDVKSRTFETNLSLHFDL